MINEYYVYKIVYAYLSGFEVIKFKFQK